jgi:uncharacterized membrane protein (DUF2068 family)
MTTSGATVAGVRAVALFEGAKGVLVLIVGFGLLALVHRDAQRVAEAFVAHLHLNPARHYPRIFLRVASRLDSTRLVLLACGAFAYAALRLAEAYGLWRMRPWAEWLAIVSSGLYLPLELFELLRHANTLRAFVFFTNTLVVCGLLYVRLWRPRAGGRGGGPLGSTISGDASGG